MAEVKDAIIAEINSSSFSKILSAVLVSQVTSLFDNDAKKEDIEELKTYLTELVSKNSAETSGGGSEQTQSAEEGSGTTYSSKEVESLADEEEGGYKDSTVAANFNALQQFVEN